MVRIRSPVPARVCREPRIQLLEPARHAVRAPRDGVLGACSGQLRAQLRRAQQSRHLPREVIDVLLRDQRAARIAQHGRRAHDRGRHDRNPQRHRLDQHQPLGFGGRREHERIAGAIGSRAASLRRSRLPKKRTCVLQAQFLNERGAGAARPGLRRRSGTAGPGSPRPGCARPRSRKPMFFSSDRRLTVTSVGRSGSMPCAARKRAPSPPLNWARSMPVGITADGVVTP